MIYYVTAVKDVEDQDLYTYLLPSLTTDQSNNLFFVTNDEANSICEKYNIGVQKIKQTYGEFGIDDVVVFLHSDVSIHDDLLEDKLELLFDDDKQLGMAGVYGTTLLTEHGGWWMSERSNYGRGHIIQGLETGLTKHMVDRIGYFDDIVSLDGCFMAIRGGIMNYFKFDESYGGYHFYDVDTSLSLQHEGWKIAVADILIKHQSEGPVGDSWTNSKHSCINKWKAKGVIFPVTSKQMKELPNERI